MIPAPFAVNLHADEKNWVEPDISVICDSSKLSERGCEGPPDWIIEVVSPSSTRNDYITKLLQYRGAKVREYWIVNPMRSVVQTYIFEGEENSNLFSFDEKIAVQIFDSLEIRFSDLLK